MKLQPGERCVDLESYGDRFVSLLEERGTLTVPEALDVFNEERVRISLSAFSGDPILDAEDPYARDPFFNRIALGLVVLTLGDAIEPVDLDADGARVLATIGRLDRATGDEWRAAGALWAGSHWRTFQAIRWRFVDGHSAASVVDRLPGKVVGPLRPRAEGHLPLSMGPTPRGEA